MKEMESPAKGTCMDMCPKKEIQERTKFGLLHKLEIKAGDEGSPRPQADQKKVVKQFVRSNANQQTTESSCLRPAPVLIKTVDYLLDEVAAVENLSWNVVYDYVFDRLRAVRQDMAIQDIQGADKIYVLEKCVIFHLYSAYLLCEESVRIFDAHTNDIHLRDCLDALLVQYTDHQHVTEKRNIFECVFVLRNLGSTKALTRYIDLPPVVRQSPVVQKCYQLSIAQIHGNYFKILKEVSKLPNILRFAINDRISDIQHQYLRVISFGYCSLNCKFPVSTLSDWLCPFESRKNGEAIIRTLCAEYGFEFVDSCSIRFKKDLPNVNKMKRKWGNFDVKVDDLKL